MAIGQKNVFSNGQARIVFGSIFFYGNAVVFLKKYVYIICQEIF